MANLPHLFRVDGRLHELVLHIRPWSDYGSARLGYDELAHGRRKAGAIRPGERRTGQGGGEPV